jgi:hypothetical protein
MDARSFRAPDLLTPAVSGAPSCNREVSMQPNLLARVRRTAVLIGAAVLVGATTRSPAAAAERFEKLIPADAVLYFTVSDTKALRSKWEASVFHRIAQEPQVRAFLEKPLVKLESELEERRDRLGFTLHELVELPQGQVALALLAPAAAPAAGEGVVLLVDVGTNLDEAKSLVETLCEKAVAAEAKRVEREHLGVKITVLAIPPPIPLESGANESNAAASPEAPGEPDAEDEARGALTALGAGEREVPAPGVKQLAFATTGTLLLVGTEVSVIEKVITHHVRPSGGSLADDEEFQRSLRRAGSAADAFFYLPLDRLLKVRAPDEQTDEALVILGLRGIRSLSAGFSLQPGVIRTIVAASVLGEHRGLLRLFPTRRSPVHLPEAIPEDVVTAGAIGVDVAGFVGDLESTLQSRDAEGYAQYRSFLEELKSKTDLDLKADLLASLGHQLSYYTRARAADSGQAAVTPLVLFLSHKGRDRMEQGLEKLLALSPQPLFTTREHEGVTIHELKVTGAAPGTMPLPAFAVTPDHLVIATSAALIEEVLRGTAPRARSLATSTRFTAATAALPQNRTGVRFSDDAKSVEGALESLRSLAVLFASTGKAGEWIDVALFPPPSAIARHLGSTGLAVVHDEEGILLVSHSYPASTR